MNLWRNKGGISLEWSEIYKKGETPDLKQIAEHINSPLWEELKEFIETKFKVTPKIEHSICSLKPGWNVKYRKSNKSICTIYPNENFFTCMVTAGSKNKAEIECLLPICDKYIQEIYENTGDFNGSKWLMIDVTSKNILRDVEEIISIKMK